MSGQDLDQWTIEASAPDGQLNFIQHQPSTQSRLGLKWPEIKLLIIAGIGFCMDAYDLFVINMIVPILILAYYPPGQESIPWGLDGGLLKAAANLGNVVGQIIFGILGDRLGRSYVYGKELVIVMIGVIMVISVPSTPHFSPNAVSAWISGWRFLMGMGIGGDYCMSATIVSDRARLQNRGLLLAIIFSNQGLGNLLGGLAAVVVIAAYKNPVMNGDLHKLDGAWRILQSLTLVPAFGVIYYRFTLVESTRYRVARQLQDASAPPLHAGHVAKDANGVKKQQIDVLVDKPARAVPRIQTGTDQFIEYFSHMRHLRLLLGTCLSWFLIDVTFYGIALNQSAILSAIGFTTDNSTVWSKLMKTATGNLIITSAGFLPGYWLTIALIEIIGRKPIQLIGFCANAVFFAILGARYDTLKDQTVPFFVVFVLLQLSFNFGANSTSFIIPAEAFPTRVRALAHGLSAACGKLGAIIASLCFAELSKPSSIGPQGVFWTFAGISLVGFVATLFLTIETKGYDADVADREEEALGAEVTQI